MVLGGAHLEGALDGLVLAQVEVVNELLDLCLALGILLLPSLELCALVDECRILIQGLAIHMPAPQKGIECTQKG